MGIEDIILGIVASEQSFIASILSAEAVKASVMAGWVNAIDVSMMVSAGLPNVIINKAINIESSVAHVIDAAADKEIAIAAKVRAVKGQPANVKWTP